MATGQGAIGTWSEIKTKCYGKIDGTMPGGSQCPTKSEITAYPAKSGYVWAIPSSYDSNQLVKYSDVIINEDHTHEVIAIYNNAGVKVYYKVDNTSYILAKGGTAQIEVVDSALMTISITSPSTVSIQGNQSGTNFGTQVTTNQLDSAGDIGISFVIA